MIERNIAASKKRKMHPNSLANLNPPYKKGQNGNPKPGQSLKARLLNVLADNPHLAKQLIESTLQGAILREPTPFKEVWDRVDGKLSSDDDKKITYNDIKVLIVYEEPRQLPEANTDE